MSSTANLAARRLLALLAVGRATPGGYQEAMPRLVSVQELVNSTASWGDGTLLVHPVTGMAIQVDLWEVATPAVGDQGWGNSTGSVGVEGALREFQVTGMAILVC